MTFVRRGAPPGEATAAAVLVHGRGSDPEDMLGLAGALARGLESNGADLARFAWAALRAPEGSWYPYGFMEPLERNQPEVDESLAIVGLAVDDLVAEGLPRERVALIGFSQGACLCTEHAVRAGGRLGAVIGLSGGLIGPPGTPWDYGGSLEDTPVFLGCSDIDPHIPEARVRETAEVLAGMGAQVSLRIYPGMAHTVNQDEIDATVSILQRSVLTRLFPTESLGEAI